MKKRRGILAPLVVLSSVLVSLAAFATPRPPLPPLPNAAPTLFQTRFDEAYYFAHERASSVTVNYGTLVESFSGYALQRSGVSVVPFVVSALDATGRVSVATDAGAVGFWFKPDWTSATAGGNGPGYAARLVEMVAVGNQQTAVGWSLQASGDGSALVLFGAGGAEPLLHAEIGWTAGEWHWVVINYGVKTELWIDGTLAAEGSGTVGLPPQVAGLVLGSTVLGSETAGGEFEDVYAFRRPLTEPQVGFYFLGMKQRSLLGPISAEEEAAVAAARAKRMAERAALAELEGDSGGMPMLRLVGGTSECITNSPLYITNTTCFFDTNQGWVVTFDVQGTNGPVDIYTTTNLSGNITNAQWDWLERGPSCSTYQYTNQPTNSAFYILGTTNDTDGDGLTDAYELLVSKTLVSTNDSDGDSMPDAWEVAHGLDPHANDASEDPDADGLTNYYEYLHGTDPQSGTMVVAWGRNSSGQCNVLADLRDVVAVAGGEKSSFALKQNGTVLAWGGNTMGETNVPATLTNVSAIAANGYANCSTPTGMGLALSNGVVMQWGTNLGNPPTGLSSVRALAVGAFHGLALKSDGTVVSWGNTNQWAARVPAALSGVKAIATGWHHSVALLSNGTVNVWGLYAPQLGYTLTNVPSGLTDVAAVSAYGLHSLALRSNGTVVAWGYNQCGQTNVPSGLSNVVAVAAGAGHNLALKNDGTVVTWGIMPGTPASLDKVTAIASGQDHCLAVRTGKLTPVIVQQPVGLEMTNGGTVSFSVSVASLAPVSYQWQANTVNLSGATNATLTLANVQASASYRVTVANSAGSVQSSNAALTIIVPGPPVIQTVSPPLGLLWVKTFTSPSLTVFATAVGEKFNPISYRWQRNGVVLTNQMNFLFPPGMPATPVGGNYSVTVTNALGGTNVGPWYIRTANAGAVAGWGPTDADWLDTPASATNIIALTTSLTHSLAVREDGTVIAWGSNDYGETNAPVSLTNALAVAGGNNHSLALRADGTVVAWGRNHLNQTNVPSGLTNVTGIAAGGNQSLALLRNGTVTNWGATNGTIPASLTSAMAIAAGSNFSLALRSNGTVVAWGANDFGQTNVPSSLTNVVAIAAGGYHALALKVNGTVVAWGSLTNPPADLTNVMTIAAGGSHSAAIRNNGKVVSWTDNTYGLTNVTEGLSEVKLLAAGGDHTLVSVFSPLVQYPVDVTKDLLLLYNTTSTNSIWVKDYYLARRPMVNGANELGIACTTNETFLPDEYTNVFAAQVQSWLTNNPTKRPQYVVLFLDMPSRVNTNNTPGVYQWDFSRHAQRPSVQYQLHSWCASGWHPFVTSINMNGTNDCKAYVDKLEFIGTNYSSGNLLISAAGYGNTNFVVDNVRHDDFPEDSDAAYVRTATNALLAANVSPQSILYAEDIETCNGRDELNNCTNGYLAKMHLTNAVNVTGYISWGFHSSLGNQYATANGAVKWNGNSSWFIVETIESNNGKRFSDSGNFLQWFSSMAFGGTNYSNTPVGAVTHTDEPGLGGVNVSSIYFGLWASEWNFAISAWNSQVTPYFQAVGDPLVKK